MAKQKIESVCEERYGVGMLACDALVIEWAAEHIAKTDGPVRAAREWKRANAKRYRLGKYTTIPQYGTELFKAYFA